MLKTLYRAVGKKELDLILNNRWLTFPDRFSHQTVFNPTPNFAHAAAIAKQFLTQDANADYMGFVTSFQVYSEYLKKFADQNGAYPSEIKVPASESYEFNLNIHGGIQIVSAYCGAGMDYSHLLENPYLPCYC